MVGRGVKLYQTSTSIGTRSMRGAIILCTTHDSIYIPSSQINYVYIYLFGTKFIYENIIITSKKKTQLCCWTK